MKEFSELFFDIDDNPLFTDSTKEYLKDYFIERIRKEKSAKKYYLTLCRLCEFSGKQFEDLIPSDIRAYFASLHGYAPRSLNWQLTCFRSYAKYLRDKDISRVYMIFNGIQLEQVDMDIKKEELPDYEDIDRVFTYLKNHNDYTTFLAISLALRLSLTTSETVGLQRQQFLIDRTGNYGIRIPSKTFGGRDRFINVPDDMTELIAKAATNTPLASPETPLLTNKQGNPITERTLQAHIKNACEEAGVKPFTIRKLRTLSIARLFASGNSTETIQRFTGTTDMWFSRYDRVVKELEDKPKGFEHLKMAW